MLVSIKVKKVLEAEIKKLELITKNLEETQTNYSIDYSETIKELNKSINYYKEVQKNGK